MLFQRGKIAARASQLFTRNRLFSVKSATDSSKVYLRNDAHGGLGVFAAQPIKKGDVVEYGIVRRLPVDGHVCPNVMVWSDDKSVWVSGSGCALLYNASLDGTQNAEMSRFYDKDLFEIHALKDIAEHEEVTRIYHGIDYRKCYQDLKMAREGIRKGAFTPTKQPISPGDKSGFEESAKVYTKHDAFGEIGVYATAAIKKGELVERGVVRRLNMDAKDADNCPHLVTWSEDGSVLASGSGAMDIYKCSMDGKENVETKRFYDEDRFEMYANRDIDKDEELTCLYKSLELRECFAEIKELREILPFDRQTSSDRALMTEYWASDHSAPTLENMMLDSDAAKTDVVERPEILAELPSLAGKEVLELGAGIGRFSGLLADKANKVVAVDFVEGSCVENRRANADKPNLEVLKADVTLLELPLENFDLVFSNWLLMYLTDSEVRDFAMNALKWLKPGGQLFFRESCFHSSGDAKRRFNPTQYRDPEMYAQMFSECVLEDGSRFQLVATNCVDSYAELKDNVNQMWFRWTKLSGVDTSPRQKRMLSSGQYSTHGTLRYEKIYGKNYVNTGGDAVSQQLLEACEPWLKPGARCLDIGCGLGGTALYFAERCPDVYVHGVSTSASNMALLTGRHVQRSRDLRRRVTFDLAPEGGVPEHELKYSPNSFDVIIIRETMMYLDLQDKSVLLRKAARLLRPGGRLVVVDYCAGNDIGRSVDGVLKDDGLAEKLSQYILMKPAAQEALLSSYFEVEVQDHTETFIKCMQEGQERIESKFGPATRARNVPLGEEGVTAMREALEAHLKAVLPQQRGWDNAAEEATDAALDKVSLHVSAMEANADVCAADYKWAMPWWKLKERKASTGQLRWYFFLATRADIERSA